MSNDGQDKKRVAVMGAGSWGTAIATALAVNGHDIRLWGRNASMMADMQSSRENSKYLPGVKLGPSLFMYFLHSRSEVRLKRLTHIYQTML